MSSDIVLIINPSLTLSLLSSQIVQQDVLLKSGSVRETVLVSHSNNGVTTLQTVLLLYLTILPCLTNMIVRIKVSNQSEHSI